MFFEKQKALSVILLNSLQREEYNFTYKTKYVYKLCTQRPLTDMTYVNYKW